jgi:hypothetical protein
MNSERFFELVDAASVRCLATLIHFLWQGTVVALLTGAMLRFLRRGAASLRYAVAVAGLALMALCPMVTFVLLAESTTAARAPVLASGFAPAPGPVHEPGPGHAHEPGALPADVPPAAETPVEPPPTVLAATPASNPPDSAAPVEEPVWKRWAPFLASVYVIGVLLLLGRLTLGLHGGRRLCRQALPVTDASLLAALHRQVRALHLRAAPLLAVCPHVVVPTVVGILRPTILLPLSIIAGLAPDEVEAILAHELAHLRRYDHLVNVLQRLIEAFLFFHPALWWLSRRIRIERENCCDDLVVLLGAAPSAYAASLLHMAELVHAATRAHVTQPRVEGVHAVRNPSTLRQRIARLLGVPDEPAVRLIRAWPLAAAMALAAVLVVPALLFPGSSPMTIQAAQDDSAGGSDWGKASGGLQARIMPVAPNADEQKPDAARAKRVKEFAQAEDVTFLVELKNVSDKAISLQGTRYGDSVSRPWPGKSASDHFAPLLFDCEFFDKNGKQIDRPARAGLGTDRMLMVSSGLAEKIEPGKSLVCLVRPVLWDPAIVRLLATGTFQARLRYHGPSLAAQQSVKQHWPKNGIGSVWNGDVASARVSFTIPDAPENRRPDLMWGPPVNGLQMAAEYRSTGKTPQARRDTATATFPHGTRLQVLLHVQNVSAKDISFWSETWTQDNKVFLTDAAGKEKTTGHAWYSGWTNVERWTLKPGQVAVIPAINIGIAAEGKGDKEFDHPIGSIVAIKPGKYKLRQELHFNGWQRTDKNGQKIPGKDDWQGTLSTGTVPITVRERRAEDEPPTFTARLRFQSPDGKSIEAGEVKVYRQSGMRLLLKGKLTKGLLAVPKCPLEALMIDVRAPGFEETRLYDVAVEPDRETSLTLKAAEPARFRLVTAKGEPVAGAKVRYFNRSKDKASAGPYPTDGLQGPVWATSNAAGEVVLDTLRKFDPQDQKLGNDVYWFYIEPPNLAPLFIGPVQAGQDLGKITVSPFLEAAGEIRGTPAELDAFAAEWDQPYAMKWNNGKSSWDYVRSQPLKIKRDGNRLTFHLVGLSPGKLRIVSRFKKGGKPISHEYAKRVPNEDDVVFEIQLNQSRNDLVITSQPKEGEKR